jgi:hypothetical protein
MGNKGRLLGASTLNWYKWKISVYDLETDLETTGRYFSIKHFNDIHGENYTSDTVAKVNKLHIKFGDYSMNDVKKSRIKTPCSVLSNFGHLKFEKIREPVIYEIIKRRIE